MRFISLLLIVSLGISSLPINQTISATFPTLPINEIAVITSDVHSSLYQEIEIGDYFETNYVLGEQQSFWIYDYYLGDIQIQATLISVGSHCYIYMDDRAIATIGNSAANSTCVILKNEFDQTIYPKGIELAGDPNGRFGDIDGDPKVTILLVPIDPYGGYYRFDDEDPSSPYSNHREMIFVNSNRNILDIIKTTTHEFNHLIWGNYEQDEAPFLTEGAANYALFYSGYLSNLNYITVEPALNLCAETHSFSSHPEIPLLGWHYIDSDLVVADYGQAYMFMFYLAERFGDDFIAQLVSETLDGPIGIDHALASSGYNISFNEIYLNWITACTIDEVSFGDGLYGFNQANFTISKINTISSFPAEIENKKYYYYGFDIKKVISPPNEFTFQITNPPSIYSLGLSIIVHDKNGWNVTQILHTSDAEVINTFITGSSIDFVYIVTSLMFNSTPITYSYNGIYHAPDIIVLLDCLFVEGHLPSETKVNGITKAFTLLFPIAFCTRILISYFRKKHS
ncbi:MAG TPA: hypothetical protein VMZ29_12115 [Candidatus Bathyarchaeia archaeon]|nr:hypothetical protein [Candidatus Bathyarchaeia archaeon]